MNITASTTNNNILRSKNSTTTQACAACKYQRRKCEPNCLLAPYFPHNRQVQFLNAHKLFGVSNITKIIRNLSPADKDQAMKTIIFESDVRANDPIGGCYRIIRDLQYMIEYYQAELDLVLRQISVCRAQQAQQAQTQAQVQIEDSQGDVQQQCLFFTSSDQAVTGSDAKNANLLGCPIYHDQPQQEQSYLQLAVNNKVNQGEGEEDNNFLGRANSWMQNEEEMQKQQERVINHFLSNCEDN